MAALSIDVVTLYTARSEAQLAADAAALAAARVLANSGATSDTSGASMLGAWSLAQAVALQVAEQNKVGGVNLTQTQIILPAAPGGTDTNPTVTVKVQKTDLPVFFARIWGTRQVTVGASATAEAYNPSGANALGVTTPVAPTCVKPWLLPNIDPSGGTTIFGPTGAITDPTLLGWTSNNRATRLSVACAGGDCSTGLPPPVPWKYYPGDPAYFPPPTVTLTCSQIPTPSPYQYSVAGCIQTAIACGSNPQSNYMVGIDLTAYLNRDLETVEAVNCLTHSNRDQGDSVNPAPIAGASIQPPFEFIAGNDNPIPGLAPNDVMVSDSLVTVPVFNSSTTAPTSPVQIIGFVQLFLNPEGFKAHDTIKTTVINMAGCGTGWTGTPILGNGASPVTARLISPP